MRTLEFQLGMRVRRRSGEGSFVKDRLSNTALKGRRIGIVVGLPEAISSKHRGVLIQWLGSVSPPELVFIHRLEALPTKEQPVALGGNWVPDETTFIGGKTSSKP
jgi:hypothetical protein